MIATLKKITLIEFLDFMGIALMYPEHAAASSLEEFERGQWERDMSYVSCRERREGVKASIDAMLARDDVDGIVIFENLDMWSSKFGNSSAMCYGPGCTYKTIEDVRGRHLNDLPSQRQYPTQYYEKE